MASSHGESGVEETGGGVMETHNEVLQAMRERVESMKPGGMRNVLNLWLVRLEAAGEPIPAALPRSGVYDNRATMRREIWEAGRCGPTQVAERCPKNKPFGTFPDVTPAAGSAE